VLQALKDGEESVRARALDLAVSSAIALPQDALEDVVRNDSSPLVRLLAMEAITHLNPEDLTQIKTIAEFALGDTDPEVREQAQSLLDMAAQPLDVPSQRMESTEPSEEHKTPGR